MSNVIIGTVDTDQGQYINILAQRFLPTLLPERGYTMMFYIIQKEKHRYHNKCCEYQFTILHFDDVMSLKMYYVLHIMEEQYFWKMMRSVQSLRSYAIFNLFFVPLIK